MLHIVAWLAVYAVILFALGEAARPWRTRRWFKTLFLPGVLVSIAVQTVAARLCVGGRIRTAPLKSGQAAFFLEKSDVPWFAGALFVLISQGLFYALFFFTVRQLEWRTGFDGGVVVLPGLSPEEMMEGTIHVDAQSYFASLWRGLDAIRTNPLPYLALLYVVAPAFATVRLRGREFFWAALLIVVAGYPVYVADRLGIGFSFLTRAFVFPEWWGIFSLYVTTAAATLALCAAPALGRLLWRTLRSEDSGSERRERTEEESRSERKPVAV